WAVPRAPAAQRPAATVLPHPHRFPTIRPLSTGAAETLVTVSFAGSVGRRFPASGIVVAFAIREPPLPECRRCPHRRKASTNGIPAGGGTGGTRTARTLEHHGLAHNSDPRLRQP